MVDRKASNTLSPTNKRLRNNERKEKSNLNSRSVSTQCIADDPNFLGYKSLPSSIQHGLSEKILHKVSDKLEKLLPSAGHHVNHQERQTGVNLSKNPCHQQQQQQRVDPSENTQRSNSLSLGQSSASSRATPHSNSNGQNVISGSETGRQRSMEENECQNPISSKKHSLASSDFKHETSANCKNGKGK